MAKTKTKPPVDEEVEDLELEDLDEDVDEDEAPAKAKSKKDRDAEITFGIKDLCALLESKTGKAYTPRDVRTLIRKMARDGSGRVNREISPDNRTRYDWSGPDDPEVKRIVKAVGAGELEAGKKEALDKLKADKAAQKAAGGGTKKSKGKKGKKAAKVEEPEEPEDDDEDLELEDDDDE